MIKHNYLFLFMLCLATHTYLHAAQANVEVKEREEKQLTAEEQAAAREMLKIVEGYSKISDAQRNELQTLLQRYPQIIDAKVSIFGEGTPLILASNRGHTELINLFIESGAKLDETDCLGNTALMSAASTGRTEIVKLLITAGAKLDKKDSYDRTALMHAAQTGQAEIIKLLVAAGAQIDAKDDEGKTARDSAILNNHKELYDKAVEAGLAERQRYLQAQQVARKELEQHMIPDLAKITAEYAYNPRVTEDLPQDSETPLEKAQRITKEIQEKKKQKALSGKSRNKK